MFGNTKRSTLIIIVVAAVQSYNIYLFCFSQHTANKCSFYSILLDQKDVGSKSDKSNGDIKRINYTVDLIRGVFTINSRSVLLPGRF